MAGKFNNSILVSEQEENDNTPDGGPESLSSIMLNDTKMTSSSSSSPKRSKRAMHKRVVSVPFKDVEGSRMKGENAPPPSDSWAWRKYGQKPIKGSPYPRGYYRCSSSKGCPARKQVERSRVDPAMLVVTYSWEHNHPLPPPSRTHHHHQAVTTKPTAANSVKPEISTPPPENPEPQPAERFSNLGDDSLITNTTDEFFWFGEMETASSTILANPIFAEQSSTADGDLTMFFPMREEDESLFADLGELPECTAVFRQHRSVGPEVQIY